MAMLSSQSLPDLAGDRIQQTGLPEAFVSSDYQIALTKVLLGYHSSQHLDFSGSNRLGIRFESETRAKCGRYCSTRAEARCQSNSNSPTCSD
jgi:hypothetical protein